MNRLVLALSLISFPIALFAQNPKPVHWSYSVKQKNNTEAELVFKAKIDKGYHMYSQDINPDVGPIPTTFTFKEDKGYALDGKVSEGTPTEIFDPNFGIKLKYFSDETVFVQKVKLNAKDKFTVNGMVTFMVCDDKRCFPPEDVEYSFTVNDKEVKGTPGAKTKE